MIIQVLGLGNLTIYRNIMSDPLDLIQLNFIFSVVTYISAAGNLNVGWFCCM